jgi:hypothetical protein
MVSRVSSVMEVPAALVVVQVVEQVDLGEMGDVTAA